MRKTQPQRINSLFISRLLRGELTACRAGRLIECGDAAHSAREYEALSLIGTHLCTYPVSSGFYAAGELFKAIADGRSAGSRAQAVEALEGSPLRARANLALGSNELEQADPDAALRLYQQAMTDASGDYLIRFLALQNAAIAMDFAGNRCKAEGLLDSIAGLAWAIRTIYPAHYLNYLNSRALVETNRERAIELATVAASSPFAANYPEWKATLAGLIEQTPKGMWSGYGRKLTPRQLATCRIYTITDNPSTPTARLERIANFAEGLGEPLEVAP
jgi:hypothetical protein